MVQAFTGGSPTGRGAWLRRRPTSNAWSDSWPLRLAASTAATFLAAAVLVFLIEAVARGSLAEAFLFLQTSYRPGRTTVAFVALALIGADALLGRTHGAVLVIGPPVLVTAWICRQKMLYLGDPLYPTDFLFARQIVDLLPMLARDRPLTAIAAAVVAVAAIASVAAAWAFRRRLFRPIPLGGRALSLAAAAPALVCFVSIMDYATFSWTRDRLQILPMMWDQKENYAHNGFAIAFALNVPMADISEPAGYSAAAIRAIDNPPVAAIPAERPDIIVVMSESFWDPTRLPGVAIEPDPLATVRALQSGHVFSPEFGGMTSNVEFEALTGFSNAFLPYGSIPYQQYVRRPIPSLAAFLKSEGYETRALHPYREWFWNRGPVYDAFGFDSFRSEERLPPLDKRGPHASDAALTEELIRQAENAAKPFFFFAVTMQNHGPYEPNRYADAALRVETAAGDRTRQAVVTYAEGVADADRGLARLVEWAGRRRRPTVIAFFGDHLPPLGPVYVDTGFMREPVAARTGPVDQMSIQHETPLVVWSNRAGPSRGIGSVSPAFLPLHILEAARMKHPYYTGFLGAVRDRYRVVDRRILVRHDGHAIDDWIRSPPLDPVIRDYRLLQYDILFGRRHGAQTFFPETQKREIARRRSGGSMLRSAGP